jgi:hypothetical protein
MASNIRRSNTGWHPILERNVRDDCGIRRHDAGLRARPMISQEYFTDVGSGGLSLALACAFKILDPDLKNPRQTLGTFVQIFGLLL